MTTDTRPPSTEPTGYSAGAVGVTAFAAVLLIMAGLLQAIQGVVALVNDTFFVVGTEYVFTFDVTSWGWVHLAIGLVLVLVGVALLRGSLWARIVGVALACLSIVVNFLWLPYYPLWSLTVIPLWSLTVIAFDLLVIWALVAHGKDISRA